MSSSLKTYKSVVGIMAALCVHSQSCSLWEALPGWDIVLLNTRLQKRGQLVSLWMFY
jgi:hypothetical protein